MHGSHNPVGSGECRRKTVVVNDSTLISVVMPVFNGEKTILAAVHSILGQTHRNLELIVVNDGSTDRTIDLLAMVHDERLHVIDTPKRSGVGAARQWGLEHAKGEFIAVQDADDISYSERLKVQLAYMLENRLSLCGTWAYLVAPSGGKSEIIQPVASESVRKGIAASNPFVHSSVMFVKKDAESVGGYNALGFAEDYDLWLRMLLQYRAGNVPKFLVEYAAPSDKISYLLREQTATANVRWRAVRKYGYPWWNTVFVLTPLLAFFVPKRLKTFLKKIFLLRPQNP
jgi:glycosyltransferase involved in cell wall biosynthesis